MNALPDLADDYLLQLTLRLVDGLGRIEPERRERHAAYLRTAQNPDGGFSGREGGSDLYYTAFALRGLAVLDVLTADVARKAGAYLSASLQSQASIVDLFSLLYAAALVELAGAPSVFAASVPDWPQRVAAAVETFRANDGGYAKSPGGAGSTYHTFLAGLSYQILGEPWPQTDAVLRFIDSRRREDGGYVELAPMRRSGTNPTAAAIGVRQLLGGVDSAVQEELAAFMSSMVSIEGGVRANARAPVADLLSTFTGTWTLHQLGADRRIDLKGLRRYVDQLELSTGGFRAGVWDDRADVEYTFYGLGCLALTAE